MKHNSRLGSILSRLNQTGRFSLGSLGLKLGIVLVLISSCTFSPTPKTDQAETAATDTPNIQPADPTATATPVDPPTPTPADEPAQPPVGVREGNTAPDFSLQNLQGETVTLSELRGKAVLLNFWAVWCGYCRIEMPDLQTAYEEFGEAGFVVLGIDIQENQTRVETFVQDMGLTFPILLDDQGQVALQYRIRGLPTSILVDTEGVIRLVHLGPITHDEIAAQLIEMDIQ